MNYRELSSHLEILVQNHKETTKLQKEVEIAKQKLEKFKSSLSSKTYPELNDLINLSDHLSAVKTAENAVANVGKNSKTDFATTEHLKMLLAELPNKSFHFEPEQLAFSHQKYEFSLENDGSLGIEKLN